jgi:hypothetical protein
MVKKKVMGHPKACMRLCDKGGGSESLHEGCGTRR